MDPYKTLLSVTSGSTSGFVDTIHGLRPRKMKKWRLATKFPASDINSRCSTRDQPKYPATSTKSRAFPPKQRYSHVHTSIAAGYWTGVSVTAMRITPEIIVASDTESFRFIPVPSVVPVVRSGEFRELKSCRHPRHRVTSPRGSGRCC